MKIKVLHNPEGAKLAEGLTVIIDVFRAFTTECYVINNGAEKIIPVGSLDLAYQLKAKNPDFILMGEQQGERPTGFQYGNSPFDISDIDFNGKTVVHISSAGTKGLSKATKASQIITGSFVNIGAIIRYIRAQQPDVLSLVCTGTQSETIRDEDALCAEYIKNELEGVPNDFDKVVEHIKKSGYIDRFLDPSIPKYPIEDIDYCLALDKFNFVIKASPYGDNLVQMTINK